MTGLPRLRAPWATRAPALSCGPIGLEIGPSAVRLCQLRPSGEGRYEVVASCQQECELTRAELLAQPLRFRKLVRSALKCGGFSGRSVVAAMPPSLVRFLPISYQDDSGGSAQAVLKALGSRVEGDLSQYVVDYLPVRQGAETEEHLALAALALRSDVTRFLDLLAAAGLRPQALDIGPSALKRLLGLLYRADSGTAKTVMVLNSSGDKSYVSVISGRRLLFDQAIDFGENTLLNDIEQALDLTADIARQLISKNGIAPAVVAGGDPSVAATLREVVQHSFIEMVAEIQRILVFTAAETHGRAVDHLYVFGSLARLKGIDALLAELLAIEAPGDADGLDGFFVDAQATGAAAIDLPEMAIAVGLALRGLVDDA